MVNRLKFGATFVFSVVALFETTVYAASFDCHKASSNIEQTICNDADLNEVDTQLGQVYQELREQLIAQEKKSLKREQILWIKQRNKECLPYDVNCLLPLYEDRIGVLKLRLSTSATKSISSVDEKLTPSTKVMLKSMGPIKFGMTVAEAEKASGLNFTKNALTPKCNILIPQGEVGHDINFTAVNGKVMSVHVFGEGITTKSGIGVGNTEKELLKKYSKNIQLLDTVSSTGDVFKILAFVPKEDKEYRVIFVVHEGLIQDFSAGLMPYVKDRCETGSNNTNKTSEETDSDDGSETDEIDEDADSEDDNEINAEEVTTLDLLQGNWASSEDNLYVVEITDQRWKDIYDGESSPSTSFKLVSECEQKASHDPNGKYLETEDAFCYSIDHVDEKFLTLMYLPRGNTLEFVKVE